MFSSLQNRALFQVFCGFAPFEEFASTDPLGLPRFARIFFADNWHVTF